MDRAAIARAALALADRAGLDAITMAAVAGDLGVTPMALYRHVGDKDGLLDAVLAELLAGLGDPSGTGWDAVVDLARDLRAAAHRHPAVFGLLLTRPVRAAGAVAVRDRWMRALRECGVPDERLASAERVIASTALGFLAGETGGRFAEHDPATRDADYRALLDLARGGLGAFGAPHPVRSGPAAAMLEA